MALSQATQLELLKGDLTQLKVDALVNAANASLMGGGGVDGAIHREGGPAILAACRQIRAERGDLPTGEAVITTGGELAASYVIHTVGPVWHDHPAQQARALLQTCYESCLRLAHGQGLRSLAFPNISTGVYDFPKDQAAEIALETVTNYAEKHPTAFDRIVFVCFDPENYRLYEALML